MHYFVYEVPCLSHNKLLCSSHPQLIDSSCNEPKFWKYFYFLHIQYITSLDAQTTEQLQNPSICVFTAVNQPQIYNRLSRFACCLFRSGFCLAYSEILKMKLTSPQKCRLRFNGLSGRTLQRLIRQLYADLVQGSFKSWVLNIFLFKSIIDLP